eukprot:Protomagalhaensia_wolfi_Nauph_80__2872@NODE_296_length_2867_cov_28_449788_g221_i0_p1_GENE_NODE_296_length_2867_cov_28_449788_g221_i0NODE_296_length_2867_cov_28_449788_g221_i0_p1_ORF_typecomplete_len479_score68_53Glyco_transf_34/PF05637_12/0_91_NODE_296_length_2867_cov_28_449788_g221_i0581494
MRLWLFALFALAPFQCRGGIHNLDDKKAKPEKWWNVGGKEIGFNLWIRKSPDTSFADKKIAVNDLNKTLHCDNVFLHAAANPSYERAMSELFVRRQLEWLPSTDCYISVSSLGMPLPHNPNGVLNYTGLTNSHQKYRTRYDAMMVLTRLVQARVLKTFSKSTFSKVPWILYTDYDVVPMNKKKTISSLIHRVHLALSSKGDTTETRLCGTEPYDDCHSNALTPSDIKGGAGRVALVVGIDYSCHRNNSWMINSGVILSQPSRTLGLISAATLTAFTDTTLYAPYDGLEQGRLNLALQELFDVPPDSIRRMCSVPRSNLWTPSVPGMDNQLEEGLEPFLIRRLNLDKALQHPVFHKVVKFWFPEGKLWPSEPDILVIVNDRWLNSPACKPLSHFVPYQRPLQFECGDMIAHFNGCKKKEAYLDSEFRNRATSDPRCVNLLPFRTDDDATKPFQLASWLKKTPLLETQHRLRRTTTKPIH